MAAPLLRTGPVRVRVPATSANLGPGFDSFGLALALHDDVVVRRHEGDLAVEVVGEGSDTVPRDASHLVVRALYVALARLGAPVPGLAVACANRIPHGRGLGSSAAAIVAGVLAARALVLDGEERLDADGVLALASEIEGHPDNVAACLAGGFTVAYAGPQGPRAVSLLPHPTVRAVLFVPPDTASTAEVRQLLPATVPYADAAHTAARAGLLVAALTLRPDLLLPATEDVLHQPYRAPAMPATAALVAELRDDGVPAVVSGAGPSVLALAAAARAPAVAARVPDGWTAHVLGVATTGAQVLLFDSGA